MGDLSKHFNRSEFECRCGCGADTVDAELITVLEDIREHFNMPVHSSSGIRCKKYNATKKVGGGTNSQHLKGKAADITIDNISPLGVLNYLASKYPDKYGIGRYQSFTHIDVRADRARW